MPSHAMPCQSETEQKAMTAPTARPAPVKSTDAPNPSGTPQLRAKTMPESPVRDGIPTPLTRSRLAVRKQPDPHAHEQTERLSAIHNHIMSIQDTYKRMSGLYAVLSQRLDQRIVKDMESASRCTILQDTVTSLRGDVERLLGEKRVLEGALEDAGASWTATEAALARDLAYAQRLLSSERAKRREADESVAELQVSVDSANDAVQRLQENLHALRHETQGVRGENTVLRDMLDKLEAANKQAEGYQRTIEGMFKAHKDGKEARIADLGSELLEMRACRDAVTKELRQAETRSVDEIRAIRDTLNASEATVTGLEESNASLRSRLAALDAERGEAFREVDSIRRKAAMAQEDADAAKQELDALVLERERLTEERDALLTTVDGHEAALADATRACDELRKSRDALEGELQTQAHDHSKLVSELEALQESLVATNAREGQARAEAEAAKAAVRAMEARVTAMEEDCATRAQAAISTAATAATAPTVSKAIPGPPSRKRPQGGVSASAAQLISKRRARSSHMK